MFSPCQAIFRKNTIQMSFLNLLFLIMLLISLSSAATAKRNQLSPLAKKQVEEFVNTLQEKHSLNKLKYMNLLGNISIQSNFMHRTISNIHNQYKTNNLKYFLPFHLLF